MYKNLKKLQFSLIVIILVLNGCVWRLLSESEWEQKSLESKGLKKEYQFNLAKTDKRGELLIHCIPPGKQLIINNYKITIGGNDKLEVFKYSDVHIFLEPGSYILKIGAKGFGRNSERSIFIEEGKVIDITYKGPYWMWSTGTFE